MSRRTWDLIKRSKRFYVRVYRRISSFLLVSVLLNVFLGVGICYLSTHVPEPDYYATFGEVPPVLLNPMDTPNYSSNPLLSNDPQQESTERPIPQ
jgi:intracellular multiplication protein IcmM